MILFSLLLSAGLDLSLPEFQPDDISGNYIVSSYDVSNNEYNVTEISANDVYLSNVESSALGADSAEEVSSNDALISSIDSFHDDNNHNWELFLDSYPINVHHTLASSYANHWTWKFSGSGSILSANSENDRFAYVPVQTGIEYTISNITVPTFNSYRAGVVNSIDSPTLVTDFREVVSPFESFTFRASQDGYLVFFISYSRQVGFVADWDIVEQESYTLSELGNAVIETKQGLRWLYLLVFFNIILGLTYKVLDLFGGKKHA